MERAAGWHDDPQDPESLRYFDGVEWTSRTSPKRKPGLDRAGETDRITPDEQQAAGAPPVDPRAHQGPSAQPWSGAAGHPTQGTPAQGVPGQNPWEHQTPMPGGTPFGAPPVAATPDGQPVVGWGRRLLARLVDLVVVVLLVSTLVQLLAPDLVSRYLEWYDETLASGAPMTMETMTPPQDVAQAVMSISLAGTIASLLYETIMLAVLGGTVGKLLMRLRVRPAEDAPLSWGAAALRAGVWVLPGLLSVPGALFQLVNGLWPLWDRRRQALHDRVAGTYVVSRR